MVYKDRSSILYKRFWAEFCEYATWTKPQDEEWQRFIELKDLGIHFIGIGHYRVIDEQKWMLSIIKYSIYENFVKYKN